MLPSGGRSVLHLLGRLLALRVRRILTLLLIAIILVTVGRRVATLAVSLRLILVVRLGTHPDCLT